MKYLILLFCSLLCLAASPRNVKQGLKIEKEKVGKGSGRYYAADSVDTISTKNYSEIIQYEDSIPMHWVLIGPSSKEGHVSRKVHFDYDPASLPVYFNPAAPKFFHAFNDCPKLGAFRKLSSSPLKDFLKSNKSANICPDCMQKHKTFFFIVQFLLDD